MQYKLFGNNLPTEKITGIYRIFVKFKGKEYSYIGQSVNLWKRIKFHKKSLEKKLDNQEEIKAMIKNLRIPSKDAFYYKFALFIIGNHIYKNEIQVEIIKNFPVGTNKNNILEKEYNLIWKYNSNIDGFNGIHAFANLISYNKMFSEKLKNKIKPKVTKKWSEFIDWGSRHLETGTLPINIGLFYYCVVEGFSTPLKFDSLKTEQSIINILKKLDWLDKEKKLHKHIVEKIKTYNEEWQD